MYQITSTLLPYEWVEIYWYLRKIKSTHFPCDVIEFKYIDIKQITSTFLAYEWVQIYW